MHFTQPECQDSTELYKYKNNCQKKKLITNTMAEIVGDICGGKALMWIYVWICKTIFAALGNGGRRES